MNVTLQRAGEHAATIRRLRTEICRLVGLQPHGAAIEPLPYGRYLFAFAEGCTEPAGMAEFFFYDDAFSDFDGCVYNRAYDLAQVGARSELVHVRSLFMRREHRHSIAFLYLVSSLVDVANEYGASHLTAGTNVDYDYIVRLHRTAGMRRLGTFAIDGSVQQLSLMELGPMAARARRLSRQAHVAIEPSLAAELAPRRRSDRFVA